MNKTQKVILAILIPLILIFISIIIILSSYYKGVPALIVILITLIIITIYEYDLFGKNIVINTLVGLEGRWTSQTNVKKIRYDSVKEYSWEQELLFLLVVIGIFLVFSVIAHYISYFWG